MPVTGLVAGCYKASSVAFRVISYALETATQTSRIHAYTTEKSVIGIVGPCRPYVTPLLQSATLRSEIKL